MSENYDNQLFEILKECKTLPVFLDQIFGFLNRRTDFYCLANDPNSPIGLPPNYAETIVKQTFYKWKQSERVGTPESTGEIIESKDLPAVSKEIEIESNNKTNPSNNPSLDTPKNTNNKSGRLESSHNFFSSSEHYNGAVYPNYCWSQSILEIDIYIKIPENLTTKDLLIKITNTNVSVKLKQDHSRILLEGELCDKCKSTDAIWSLDQSKLNIHLDKCKELWWNCLIKSEETKLDISRLDCTRPYDDLSDEAQAKIEELQWNQERKRLGLPTSNELAMEKVLKDAWDAEGSPFKGQPYDPSSVQF